MFSRSSLYPWLILHLLTLLLCFWFAGARAEERPHGFQAVRSGDVLISDAWAPVALKGAPTMAVYLTVINLGETENAIVSLSSPLAASAEMHVTMLTNDVASMRHLSELPLKPRKAVKMQAGGIHVMLTDINESVVKGDHFPLHLTFRDGATATVQVEVRPLI